MLTFSLIVTGLAVLVAAWALYRARTVAKRLERLSESYWELRYDVGQLKVRLNRLESGGGDDEAAPVGEPAGDRQAPTTSFIPLSSLKK